MTRRRLTARLCFHYVRDSYWYVCCNVRDDILPRLPGADRRARRRREQEDRAWAWLQQQIGFPDVISGMPQTEVVPASEPPDGDDSDSD